MAEQRFLGLVKQHGLYRSKREASRAANAVFGTIKSWISPSASVHIRQILPQDAASLWQYSPVSVWSDLSPLWRDMEYEHLILRVQQLGEYASSKDARRAYDAVLAALKILLPVGTEMIIGKRLPVDQTATLKSSMAPVAI